MKRYNCVLQLNLSYFRAATHDYDAKSFSTGYLKGPKQPHSAHLHVQVLLSQGIEGGEGPVTPRPSRKKIIIIYWLTLILSRHFRDLLVADEISDHQLGARSKFQLDHSVRGSVHHLLWIVTNNCHVTKNLADLAALLNGCEAKVKTACSTENMSNITEVSCLSSLLQIRVDHGVARSPPA